jgi:glycosyltransferase involved in cell wall biosynthesis
MTPSISVIIPAYNRAELIGETLRSLLNQTVPASEIIVVDDGSSDGTAEAAEAAFHRWESEKVERSLRESEKVEKWEGIKGPKDEGTKGLNSEGKTVGERRVAGEELSVKRGELPELKVIRQGNAGPGAARNRGLAESTGEFVHFFDSDDIAAPNKHEVQLRALLETGADIAYGPWVKGRFVEDERPFSGKVGRCFSKPEVGGQMSDGRGQKLEAKQGRILDYNLAGQTSAGMSFEYPVETFDSILIGTMNLLECIRLMNKSVKFYNAGSSEVFGKTKSPANEETPFRPRSRYATPKAAANHAAANYREAYGLFACTGILFNHESPLRLERFVTRKLAPRRFEWVG